ncbi:MAG: CorA family divalent cation transporter [Candidatus Nanoarchaeia archaeon]|jgi:Mg2+ and Co2+ transporter CorA
MVKCIVFKEGIAEIFEGDYLNNSSVMWLSFEKNEPMINFELKKILNADNSIIDDLLEEQRSNIIKFEDFSVVVLSFPKKKSEILQVTFIISKKRIISIVDNKSEIIDDIFRSVVKSKGILGITNLFSFILDRLVERSVLVLNKLEDKLEEKEKLIFLSKKNKLFLFENNEIKDNLYYLSKILKSDLEVINEILEDKISFLNLKYFGEHIQDRFLYLLDSCESLREFINSINNSYMSAINFDTNNTIYKLTIIGSLLIIPSIISGFFGMNVNLPPLSFFEILGLTVVLSIGSYFILRLRF